MRKLEGGVLEQIKETTHFPRVEVSLWDSLSGE